MRRDHPDEAEPIEQQITQWRTYLRHRQAIHSVDVAELEDHLREQIDGLRDSGLDADEAFLVAVKRLGALDALSREFAREHSDRLWKQLVMMSADGDTATRTARSEAFVAFGLAALAALAMKVPALFGLDVDRDTGFYLRNVSLFVLPLLTGYFIWKRELDGRAYRNAALPFAVALTLANIYRSAPDMEALVGLHLPIALWLVVGVAYAGRDWRDVQRRMDFVRFTGELVIYYVLIALGGVACGGLMEITFHAIGISVDPVLQAVLPAAAVAAVMIAAWLVEAKQSVIENMAPVLTRLFSPLCVVLLLAFLATVAWTGRGVAVDRDVLIAFDLLLGLVLGLLVYAISARDPLAPRGAFDVVQVVLVASALVTDGVALWAIATRIGELGFSANRVAALGENVILLVNLGWSLVLYVRFLRGRGTFDALEKWQTDYLVVYAGWAALVVAIFPVLFA